MHKRTRTSGCPTSSSCRASAAALGSFCAGGRLLRVGCMVRQFGQPLLWAMPAAAEASAAPSAAAAAPPPSGCWSVLASCDGCLSSHSRIQLLPACCCNGGEAGWRVEREERRGSCMRAGSSAGGSFGPKGLHSIHSSIHPATHWAASALRPAEWPMMMRPHRETAGASSTRVQSHFRCWC